MNAISVFSWLSAADVLDGVIFGMRINPMRRPFAGNVPVRKKCDDDAPRRCTKPAGAAYIGVFETKLRTPRGFAGSVPLSSARSGCMYGGNESSSTPFALAWNPASMGAPAPVVSPAPPDEGEMTPFPRRGEGTGPCDRIGTPAFRHGTSYVRVIPVAANLTVTAAESD